MSGMFCRIFSLTSRSIRSSSSSVGRYEVTEVKAELASLHVLALLYGVFAQYFVEGRVQQVSGGVVLADALS